MNVRSVLFGSAFRAVVTAVLGLGLLLGGAYAAGVIGAPTLLGVDNAFGPVNETTTVIETDIGVHNPNPFAIRVGGVSAEYTVSMNGIAMANGTKRGVGIAPGNDTVSLRTRMNNDRIPGWWVSHIRGDESTALTVDTTVNSPLGSYSASPVDREITTDILGTFNSSADQEIDANQPLVEDPVAVVRQKNASWGQVTDEKTPIAVEFRVYNPKSVPITVTELGYNVSMAYPDRAVDMGEGRTEEPYVIQPDSTETIRTTVDLTNANLDEWWVAHLENDQVSTLRIDFYARIDAGVTTVRVPLRGVTHETEIETDMFGNKDADTADDTGSDESASDDGSGAATTTTTAAAATASAGDETTTTGGPTTAQETTTEATTTQEETQTETTTTTEDDGIIL
jgi:LEA14-like dessication related protein